MDINSIAQDLQKETDGIVVDYRGTGIMLRIASLSSPAYDSARRRALKPFRKRDGTLKEMTERKQLDLIAPCIAEHIWLGFENMTEDGEPIPDTVESRTALLRRPELRPLYDFIIEFAGDSEAYQIATQEIAEGN